MQLSQHIKYTLGLAYASGTASRNGAELDMSGWDGVLMILTNATLASSAAGDLHAEGTATSGTYSSADLLGTKIAIADDDDDQVMCLDIYRPLLRYIRGVVTKNGSNAQAESLMYIQYTGRKLPVSDSGFDEYELHISPALGTK